MKDDFVALCLELLAPLGAARAKRMFGGHGLYVDELFVAIVTGGHLYLKSDEESAASFDAAGCAPFAYESRGQRVTLSYRQAPPQALDSPAQMAPWARLAMAAALRARVKPRKAGRPPPGSTAGRRPRAAKRPTPASG